MFDSLNFDMAPVTIPVTVFGVQYVLREASGEASCAYENFMADHTEMKDDKPYRYRNFADREPLLVSLCLYDATNTKQVPLETVRSWPYRVIEKLFAVAKEISGMNPPITHESLLKERDEIDRKLAELEKDQLGNSSTDTTAGSG